jgi:hypothetical protein
MAINFKRARQLYLKSRLISNSILSANFKVLMGNTNANKIIRHVANGELSHFDFTINGAKEKYKLKQEVAKKIIERHDKQGHN